MADKIMFRDAIRRLLANSAIAAFERYNGTLGIVPIDNPVSVTRNITENEIKIDENKIAMWNYGFTEKDDLITRIDLRYGVVIPEKNTFSSTVYCDRNGNHNFITEGPTYTAYLRYVYNTLGSDNHFTFDALSIRDSATAEKLAKYLIRWFARPKAVLSLTCTYSVLNIELCDIIGVTADCVVDVHTFLAGKTWVVVGHRIVPCVNGQGSRVELKLIELGESNLPEPETWIEVGSGGAEKIEVGAGGTAYQEVGNG